MTYDHWKTMAPEDEYDGGYERPQEDDGRDMTKIVTRNIYPPIPIRTFDWVAFYEGREEDKQYGYGRTEADAIADLRESYEEPAP